MLHRQRAIFFLIAESGGSLFRQQLIRLLYLVRHTTPTQGGSSFYDFLDQKAEPRSFALEFEIDKMIRTGLLVESKRGRLSPINTDSSNYPAIPTWLELDIQDLLGRLDTRSEPALSRHVAAVQRDVESRRTSISATQHHPNAKALYTAGYESLSIDAFLDGLRQAGIEQLIDVRRNPISRRFGFHGRTLERLCGEVSIGYSHFPRLGIASSERRHLETQADYDRLFENYRRTTLRQETLDIGHVTDLAKQRRSALLCAERCPAECHRSHLAERIREISGLKIVDLDFLDPAESNDSN